MKRKLMTFLALFSAGIGFLMAQTQVRGTVVDEKGEPIIGANIRLKSNPQQGAATNINGEFTLSAPANDKLVVSYIGFITQEVAVKSTLNIVLKADTELLDEVVVIGYGSGRKIANVSASVVKVSSKDIQERPAANPMDALQGKVAGLQVLSSSGEPSQLASMKLHGVGSLGSTTSSAPLYVLDGMPVSQSTILRSNQNDFESIQILKDAAATSIYGARAANGVVFITSKKGRASERASITVKGQYGVSNLANTRYFSNLMNTTELLDLWEELGVYSKGSVDKFRKDWGHINTEWYKYNYKRNAPVYQADVSVSGGNKSTNYYISTGLFSQDGLRYASYLDKYHLRSNINSELNKYIRVGLNNLISYSKVSQNPMARNAGIGGGWSAFNLPFISPYKEDGTEYYDELIPILNEPSPKYHADHRKEARNDLLLNTIGNVTITPTKGMTLRSQVGLELQDYRLDYLYKPSHMGDPGNGKKRLEFDRTITWSINNTAEYKFSINKDNNFTALLGHEYIDYDYHYFESSARGISDDRLTLIQNGTTNIATTESKSQYAFLSYFGQLSYDFQKKYFIDLVVRNDASSRFGKNKQSGTFWSAGLLWKAKEEAFLRDVDWLTSLDTRFSVGTQGNGSIPSYKAYALVGPVSEYNGERGWGLTTPGNDNLTWERQRKITLGIAARFFDRFGFNLELYDRLTSDMLMDVPMPLSSGLPMDDFGFATTLQNVGEYRNRGVDLRLDFDFLKRKEAYLGGYINFNYNKDKVLSLFQDRDSWILPGYGYGYIVGEPVVFMYPIYKGINPENGYPEWYLPGDDIKKTTKDKVTSDFTGTLDQNTGIRLYTPMVGGFGLNGQYKGFYIQGDFSFAWGKHMISNDKFFTENPFLFKSENQGKNVANYWKEPGDNAEFPGLDYIKNKSVRFTQFDSKMIEDASFLRLKSLTLGYNMPQRILSKQEVVKNVKFYVTSRNLWTLTKYNGPDPEVDSNLSLGANPNTTQVSFGIDITF